MICRCSFDIRKCFSNWTPWSLEIPWINLGGTFFGGGLTEETSWVGLWVSLSWKLLHVDLVYILSVFIVHRTEGSETTARGSSFLRLHRVEGWALNLQPDTWESVTGTQRCRVSVTIKGWQKEEQGHGRPIPQAQAGG